MTEAIITTEDLGTNMKLVHISGQLDESNVNEKIQAVYKVVEQVPKNLNLILDLANLEYLNSKAIGYITDIYGKLSETGGKMVIAAARPNIMDILQVVGLTQLIQLYDTIDQAKESFTPPNNAPASMPVAVAAEQVPTPVTPAVPPQVATVEAPQTTDDLIFHQPAAPVAPAETTATPAPPQVAPTETPATPSAPTQPNAEAEGTYKFEV